MICWVLTVVLVLLYVRAHHHTSIDALQVIQTELSSLSDTILLEKRPLVIVDPIREHRDLVRLSVFRLLHVWASRPRACTHDLKQGDGKATARFTLLTQAHSDVTGVEIRHPRTRAGAIVVLRRHQTLVLPPMWGYRCPHGAVVHELHDCVSLFLRLIHASTPP